MYKYFLSFTALLVLLLATCSSPNDIDENILEKYEMEKTIDETVQDDFVFKLVSEKEVYTDGDDVKLYGEITYIGEKEKITINHSSSAILFTMQENVRGYEIGFGVNDIGLSTTLKRGETYRETYKKNVGYAEDDAKDYVTFMEDFLKREGFPTGYYVVDGETDFFSDGFGRINMKATIDFKVVE